VLFKSLPSKQNILFIRVQVEISDVVLCLSRAVAIDISCSHTVGGSSSSSPSTGVLDLSKPLFRPRTSNFSYLRRYCAWRWRTCCGRAAPHGVTARPLREPIPHSFTTASSHLTDGLEAHFSLLHRNWIGCTVCVKSRDPFSVDGPSGQTMT